MRIHFLQHVPFEGPAFLETWGESSGHQFSFTRFYEPVYTLPGPDAFDALVILGGPMGVYDELEYSWLVPEKDFISSTIKYGKKILGFCLGAQLAAVCLGAKVNAARHKEIGWFPVYLNAPGNQIPWFTELFCSAPIVFHWHGDTFEIPQGSVPLLHSDANTNQAFLYGGQVLGLQFHLEARPDAVRGLLENCSADLADGEFVQDRETILNGVTNCREINRIAGLLLDHFFI